MSVTLLVKSITLADHPLSHRRVKSLHGQTRDLVWEHSAEQAVESIQKQYFHYFFLRNGLAVRIIVGKMPDGELFLKGATDEGTPAALLEIPQFNPNLSPPPISHERNPAAQLVRSAG